MRHYAPIVMLAMLAACSTPGNEPVKDPPMPLDTAFNNATAYRPIALPNLPDNVRDDTLLIITTQQLENGLFVMAARNVEETREGLRLYLYRPRPDSTADVLAHSMPAYDSQSMLPSYFATDDSTDGIIILANYGERESWGQKVFWLKDRQFIDLGWLDVTERSMRSRADSSFQKRISIAPRVQVKGKDGLFQFTFSGDSVQLFDDLRGNQEVMVPANRIAYRYNGEELILMLDGQDRLPDHPL